MMGFFSTGEIIYSYWIGALDISASGMGVTSGRDHRSTFVVDGLNVLPLILDMYVILILAYIS